MDKFERALDEHQKFIRRYNTTDLLEFFSNKSIQAFNEGKKAFTITDVPYYIRKTGGIGVTNGFGYGQWELVQICYNAIKYSNDFRGKNVEESDFYNLLNENKIYDELFEKIETGMDPIKLFEHLQCITNVQFDFQTLHTASRFNRMYQIMMVINKSKKYNQTAEVAYIDFASDFKIITGMEMERYIKIYHLLILLCATTNRTNLYDLINDIQFKTENLGFSKIDTYNFLEQEGKDYSFYKQTDNWNALKYYPIVKNNRDDNKYIISNLFSLMISFPNSIYWTIRNYYREINSYNFTIYFGKCFEYYFQEVLEAYGIKGEKLKESQKPHERMPDWKIETDHYILLIEQKSSLFPIDARITTKEDRYAKVEEFFNRNLVKAFEQLNAYVPSNTAKTVIRICLTFEKIYMEENVKDILELLMTFQSEAALNWIVNIDEMEVLMYLLGNEIEKFNTIVKEKISLERTKDPNGRTLEKLLRGYDFDYANRKINHFNNIAEELKQKLSEE